MDQLDVEDRISQISAELAGMADLMLILEDKGMYYPRVFVFLEGALLRIAGDLNDILDSD